MHNLEKEPTVDELDRKKWIMELAILIQVNAHYFGIMTHQKHILISGKKIGWDIKIIFVCLRGPTSLGKILEMILPILTEKFSSVDTIAAKLGDSSLPIGLHFK